MYFTILVIDSEDSSESKNQGVNLYFNFDRSGEIHHFITSRARFLHFGRNYCNNSTPTSRQALSSFDCGQDDIVPLRDDNAKNYTEVSHDLPQLSKTLNKKKYSSAAKLWGTDRPSKMYQR